MQMMTHTRGEEKENPPHTPGKGLGLGLLFLVLAAAAFFRWSHLDAAAVRSDEINFVRYVNQSQSLVELWKTPPWFNQIPLADSLPIVWCRWTGQAGDESSVRQPFAALGWLTVLGCTLWLARRRGLGAALLLGVWMGLSPFHIYHSREAYYYALEMLMAAGMVLRGADGMAWMAEGRAWRWTRYLEWMLWALLTGMGHMSAWVVIGVGWLCLMVAGWRGLTGSERRRHGVAMALVAGGLALGLSRWVLRAVYEMQRAAADSSTHIGLSFQWVGTRVLPTFMGGANLVGVMLCAGLLAAFLWRCRRAGKGGRLCGDRLYAALTWLVWLGVLSSYAYIMLVGGGSKGKMTYFAVNFPGCLVWAAMTLDRFFAGFGEKVRRWGTVAATLALAAVLVVPAWAVTKIEGKPTPYRAVRAWLDANLQAGDVAIVDRWLEPWNEMALYAPTNVFVNFTIPDEPYEQYVANDWRGVTQRVFEQNGAQAFIRLSQNHADRMGIWKWPETWFARRAVVTNQAGARLVRSGFAPMEEFYLNPSRVKVEIFYNTHADVAARAQKAGEQAVCFFGSGFRLFKPWQQGDWNDYRVLEKFGTLELWNLRDTPARFRLDVTATALQTPSVIKGTAPDGTTVTWTCPPRRMAQQSTIVELSPGCQTMTFDLAGTPPSPCLFRTATLSPLP